MVPAAWWAFVACWGATWAVMAWGFGTDARALGRAALAFAVGAATLLVGLLACWAARREVACRIGGACLLVACAALSATLCCLRQRALADELATSAVSSWKLQVVSDASEGSYGWRCRARILRAGSARGVVWVGADQPIERGMCLACVGRFARLTDDEYGRSSWRQGLCGTVRVVRVTALERPRGPASALLALRAWVLGGLRPAEGDGRALVAGVVCGSREALDARGLTDLFSACGAAHLIAVSGAHLSMVCALLSQLVDTLELRLRVRVAVLVTVSGCFVAFCGAPVSALRAWAMSLAAFGGQLAGRRTHPLSAVAVVGLVLVLADPPTAGQLAFVLSVCSVAALCLFLPHAAYVLRVALPSPRLPRRLPRAWRVRLLGALDGARELLAATLVCQLATLPLVAGTFGRVALVAPLANLLLGPLFGVVVPLGLGVCLLLWAAPVRGLVLPLLDAATIPVVGAMRWLSRLPLASVSPQALPVSPAPVVVLVLAIWLIWWPRVSRRVLYGVVGAAAAALCVVLGWWRLMAPARIVVLDIGQGDAILVQDGASALLVDTGPDDAVVAALARNHVLHLDAVAITHQHDDHYGGLDDLVGAVGCNRVIVARGVAGSLVQPVREACHALTGCDPLEVACGDTLQVGAFLLRVVWPKKAVDGDENAESLELLVSYERGGRSLTALLTGDAERDETGACLDAGDVGDIDLLKVGHHGSEVSLTPEMAGRLSPEVAVASAGEGNSYGHPRPECVEMLEGAGALFLCTKDVGDVDVRPGSAGPLVRTQRQRGP